MITDTIWKKLHLLVILIRILPPLVIVHVNGWAGSSNYPPTPLQSTKPRSKLFQVVISVTQCEAKHTTNQKI